MADVSLQLQLKTKMTQLQLLTVKLLSLRQQELRDFLQEQVESNPLLDIRYPDVKGGTGSEGRPIDNMAVSEASLETVLMEQLRLYTGPRRTALAAGVLIGLLDEKGFIDGSIEEAGQDCGLTEEEMADGLRLLQSLDPPGIGAANLQESLLLQTRRRQHVPRGTVAVLEEYYDAFLQGKWSLFQEKLALTAADMQSICAFLKTLSLRPAGQVPQETEYVRADAEIYIDGDGNPAVRSLEELPQVLFQHDLYTTYEASQDKKVLAYIHRARRSFLDLQTALAYRNQSILLVLLTVAEGQRPFFTKQGPLQALTQKEVARQCGLSESTVSRVCRDGHVLFARKVYGVQEFFSRAYVKEGHGGQEGECISRQVVCEKIRAAIEGENPRSPWSDQDIMKNLQGQGIHIARRTVAKLRQEMGLPGRSLRRRLGSVKGQ